MEIDENAQKIYDILVNNGGFLSVNDKTDAQKIKEMFCISKSSFKKAIGRLLKNKKIKFESDGIKLIKEM